jgi:hypothetical protein
MAEITCCGLAHVFSTMRTSEVIKLTVGTQWDRKSGWCGWTVVVAVQQLRPRQDGRRLRGPQIQYVLGNQSSICLMQHKTSHISLVAPSYRRIHQTVYSARLLAHIGTQFFKSCYLFCLWSWITDLPYSVGFSPSRRPALSSTQPLILNVWRDGADKATGAWRWPRVIG